MFIPTRTDSDSYSAVDGVDVPFSTSVEATSAGFGVKNIVKGVETFEVLDAMSLNKASVQAAVEAGSAALAATPGGAAAGFSAIDFSVNVDYVDASEIDSSVAMDSELLTSALV